MNEEKESILNLLLNLVIPSIILIKFSSDQYLGSFYGLIIALLFPSIYGLYSLIKNKKVNLISILGLISILLTGVIGLFQLDGEWLAVKEASIPLLIGMAVFASVFTKKPLINWIISTVVNLDKVMSALSTNAERKTFNEFLRFSTLLFSITFFISAILNYALTKIIVTSPAGSEQFNVELGKLTALSFPIIALPSTILLLVLFWFILRRIQKLTGLSFDDVLSDKTRSKLK